MTASSRAIVADEWALVRAGVEAVLRRNAVPRVVPVSTATAAIAAARDRSKPVDLVIVGSLPDMAMDDVVGRLAALDSDVEVRVVALVGVVEPHTVMDLLGRGAHAVLERHARDLDLPSALEHVRAAKRYVSPQLLGGLFDNPSAVRPLRPVFELTAREREVLAELVAGRSNAEIAHRLSIAPQTVKTHLAHLYAKLDVTRRSHAVAVAVRHGLV